ncbi:MAG: acyl carrier protein [Candidatus Borkfalkiaceae bacterium]|nr:acyl carrier protein [Eubacteriales bacterium]MDY5820319.1 acyl carrier protein [Christensenellaceae bacterium]
MGETFNKVADLLSEQLGISKSEIALDSDVIKDLGADSLDVVQLLMSLEEDFGITVSEEEASNLKTVEDIIKLIG